MKILTDFRERHVCHDSFYYGLFVGLMPGFVSLAITTHPGFIIPTAIAYLLSRAAFLQIPLKTKPPCPAP